MKTKHTTIVIALMLASLPLAQGKGDMRRGLDKGDQRRLPDKGDMRRTGLPVNPFFVILKTLIFGG